MSTRVKNKPLRKKLPIRGRRRGKTRFIIMKRRVGRPAKISEKLIEKCVNLTLEGLPIDKVCDYLGITPDSYYDWRKMGEKWLQEIYSKTKPEYPEHEMHALFVQCVVRARAEWQLEIQRRSMQLKSKHSSMWIRDMTLLERRDRKNWGRSETVFSSEAAPLPDESYL